MTIIQVKLRADLFLRARLEGADKLEVVFSVGPEHGDHIVPVSDATAQVLMLMMPLAPRPV